ncbi:hypothetical protein ACFL38_03670 [Candidatus Omnitrophota bacterium]
MADKPMEELSDEKLELQIKMERDYYQSSFMDAIESVGLKFKIDKDRLKEAARKVYPPEEQIEKKVQEDDDE